MKLGEKIREEETEKSQSHGLLKIRTQILHDAEYCNSDSWVTDWVVNQ